MAPQLVGLLTATPGSLQKVLMPAATGEIVVRNDSPYDVWVRLGSTPPAAAPSALTLSQYHQEVTPGQSQIKVPQPFDGCLWVGTYNPGGKAASGTISSRANIYVRAYPIGESAGAGATYAALTGLDATSQQRVINIPTEPAKYNRFQATSVDVGGLGLATLATGQNFSGTQPVTVYLYGITVRLIGSSYGRLAISVYDGTVTRILAYLWLSAEDGTVTFYPPSPLALQFTPTAAATTIVLTGLIEQNWPTSATSPRNVVVVGTAAADIDLTGQVPPPSIGNGAGTPPGVIY